MEPILQYKKDTHGPVKEDPALYMRPAGVCALARGYGFELWVG